jgi:hypothetical protein
MNAGVIRCCGCGSLLGEGELIYQAYCGSCGERSHREYVKGFDVKLPAFSQCLSKGQEGELLFKRIFEEGDKVEVKTDYLPEPSGNVLVEVEWNGKPSGLSISRACWWFFYITGNRQGFLVPTDRLREITRFYEERGDFIMCGDGKLSKCVVIPLREVW